MIAIDHAEGIGCGASQRGSKRLGGWPGDTLSNSEVLLCEGSARVAFEILFERDRFGSAVEGHCSLDPPWPEFRCVRDLA